MERQKRFADMALKYLEHESEKQTCTRAALVAVVSARLGISSDTGRKYCITMIHTSPQDYTVWKKGHDTMLTLKPKLPPAGVMMWEMLKEGCVSTDEIKQFLQTQYDISDADYDALCRQVGHAQEIDLAIRQSKSNSRKKPGKWFV